jgi:hypothetical protein
MIPSEKTAKFCRPPPENRFRKPRMLEPLKLSPTFSTASTLTPGTGMKAPSL